MSDRRNHHAQPTAPDNPDNPDNPDDEGESANIPVDAGDDADTPADAFVLEGGRPFWERRLTRRARLWRAGATVGVVLLVAYLLVGGPTATLTAITALWAAHAPITQAASQPAFAGASYHRALLPPGADGDPNLHLASAPSAGPVAYTCWIAPRAMRPDSGPLHLFVTADFGDDWTPLTAPVQTAPDCAVVVDAVFPQNIALLLGDNLWTGVNCALPTVYVSGNGGQTWRRVVWPDALLPACNFHLTSTAGHLFAWADTPLLPASEQAPGAVGRLIASGDAGQSWHAADAGLPAHGTFSLIGVRVQAPTGLVKLLAQVDTPAPDGSMLAQSWDSGASWQSYGALPGVNPQVIVSDDPAVTDHGGWGRLYELAEAATNGVADGPGSFYLATAYFHAGWRPIPLPPPVMGAAGNLDGPNNSTTNDYLNQVSLLGVGPGDNLLALRGALPTDETRESPRRRIWQWNAAQAHWLLSDNLFPADVVASQSAWSQGGLTFWLMMVSFTSPSGVLLLYATFDSTNTRLET